MTEFHLLDKHDNRYSVEIYLADAVFHAHICWNRSRIGQILCNIEPENVLFLGNIEIFDAPVLPRNGLFSRRPFQRPHLNFRQRGLGTAMLEFLIAQAQQLGMVGISGFITPDDVQKTPYLFDWYRRHGFVVNQTAEPQSRVAAMIYRELQR